MRQKRKQRRGFSSIMWPESGGTIKEFCKSGIPGQAGKVACLKLYGLLVNIRSMHERFSGF